MFAAALKFHSLIIVIVILVFFPKNIKCVNFVNNPSFEIRTNNYLPENYSTTVDWITKCLGQYDYTFTYLPPNYPPLISRPSSCPGWWNPSNQAATPDYFNRNVSSTISPENNVFVY